MKSFLLSIVLILFAGFSLICQTLTIKISGIENNNGEVRLAFFTCDKEYNSERPKITKYISKKEMRKGCLTVKITDIPVGRYGIALLDDENKNGEMDYSFFVPKEGFGFSNYYHEGLSKPDYSSFCFDFSKADKIIEIKVRYM